MCWAAGAGDGYHELESSSSPSPGPATRCRWSRARRCRSTSVGPTALAAGAGPDNLVLRAARALAERVPGLALGAFRLTKRLPVAAGIGGGSSDAAGALRLLARANGLAPDDPRILDAARATGSDVPVCLNPRLKFMRGAGEDLSAPLALPSLPAVLINPGVAVETKPVFARLGLAPGERADDAAHPAIASGSDRETLWRALAKGRNDLEHAAAIEAPIIGHVLATLSGARGLKLARMSGSGATCFGLFATPRAAVKAARAIRAAHPEWWIKPAMLR